MVLKDYRHAVKASYISFQEFKEQRDLHHENLRYESSGGAYHQTYCHRYLTQANSTPNRNEIRWHRYLELKDKAVFF